MLSTFLTCHSCYIITNHSTLALMLKVLYFSPVLKSPLMTRLFNSSLSVLEFLLSEDRDILELDSFTQNQGLAEWFGQDVALSISLFGGFSLVYWYVSLFHFILLGELKKSVVRGFTPGYLGLVAKLGTKPLDFHLWMSSCYIEPLHSSDNTCRITLAAKVRQGVLQFFISWIELLKC